MIDFSNEPVVRCFCCDAWVRAIATEIVNTGEREDPERWCRGCIDQVDITTKGLVTPAIPPATFELEEGQ